MIGVWHGVPFLFANFYYHYRQHKNLLDSPQSISRSKAYRWFLAYISFLPMLMLTLDRPVWIVILYAITGALFMPLLAFLLYYLNGKRHYMGPLVNGLLGKALLVICLLIFGYLLLVQLQNQLLA